MKTHPLTPALVLLSVVAVFTGLFSGSGNGQPAVTPGAVRPPGPEADALRMIQDGRQTFRFDTFGDEAFWGDALKLHQGVAKVSPKTALAVGLKVDMDALPPAVVQG